MTLLRIPPTEDMNDETLISHLELRHKGALRMEFKPLPGQETEPRRLAAPTAWRTYHDHLHSTSEGHDHFHGRIELPAKPTKRRAIAAG